MGAHASIGHAAGRRIVKPCKILTYVQVAINPMLIVPVENRPDWKNPPVATLLLILINVLIFFVYQGKDPQKLEQSFQLYVESGLLEREQQPFRHYVARKSPEVQKALDEADDDDSPQARQRGSSCVCP